LVAGLCRPELEEFVKAFGVLGAFLGEEEGMRLRPSCIGFGMPAEGGVCLAQPFECVRFLVGVPDFTEQR
jgi:hypothetical protein